MDPIADMLTIIRNGVRARKKDVTIPSSKFKCEIARILKEEGYISGYAMEDGVPKRIKVELKYSGAHAVISEIKRISKPGKRVYVGKDEIPSVMNGLGVAVLSTPRGVVTDREAKKLGVGGELIFSVC